MNKLFRERTLAQAAEPVMLALAEQTDLPRPLRDVLQGLLDFSASGLERPLAETLGEYEKQLVRLADKAPNNELQNCYFDSVNKVKRGRAEIVPRFLRHVEHSLTRLRSGVASAEPVSETPKRRYQLSLADGNVIDQALVLDEIVTKVETRVREPLYALGHRFGVLAGLPRLGTEIMPLGPRSLVEAMGFATSILQLTTEHQLVLYRCFERVVLSGIAPFYAALNNYLIERGIVRYLHALPSRASADEPGGEAFVMRPLREVRAPESATARGSNVAGNVENLNARPAHRRHAFGPKPRDDSGTAELFLGLRRLLGECRRAEAYTASSADLQNVIAELQTRHVAVSCADSSRFLFSGEEIKREILGMLREMSSDGRAPRIDDEDGDTIDLIATLFEFLSRCARAGGLTNWALATLQFPVLRLALKDKGFFSNPAHPARRLLDTVVDVGRFWVDELECEPDAALVSELQRVVRQVSGEADGDVLVFASALQSLQQYLDALNRRVEIAECRSIDATRRQERFESARAQASAAVAERIATYNANEFVRTLLEQAWLDVLVISLLREGHDDGMYARRLRAVDQLLLFARGEIQDSESAAEALREEIEGGLAQVGLHESEIRAISGKLFAAVAIDEDDSISQTELAIRLRRKVKFGPVGNTAAASTVVQLPPRPLSTEHQAASGRLSTLPLGTWFEFVVNAQGDCVRRKLSWRSESSGRYLFLNRYGAVVVEMTSEQLAGEIAGERARVVESQCGSLVDRAWSAIADTLKHFSAHKQGYYLGVRVVDDQALKAAGEFGPHAELARPQQRLPTLLLVDDEQNILRALTRVLRVDGYRILTATNAQVGLEILHEHQVQVIVSDQRMPEMNGTEFLAKVKELCPDTLRIVLSGYSDVATVTNAINRGVIHKFLTKPWNDEELRLEIRNAFRAQNVRTFAS